MVIAASLLMTMLALRTSRSSPEGHRNLIGVAEKAPAEAAEPTISPQIMLLPALVEASKAIEPSNYPVTEAEDFATEFREEAAPLAIEDKVETEIDLVPTDAESNQVQLIPSDGDAEEASQFAQVSQLLEVSETSQASQIGEESIFEPAVGFNAFEENVSADAAELETKPFAAADYRIAALPQFNDKPKFRKFGAAKKTEPDDDGDDEEDEEPATKQPVVLSSSNRFKLAATPKKGDRYKDDTPLTDSCSHFIPGAHGNFSPTPTMQGVPYDPWTEMNVYQGKKLYANQRPLLELGRPWYQLGPISEGSSILGFHNHVNPQYLIFGDARSAIASNRADGDSTTLMASQLNLFHHFKFTSTERFVAGMTPFSRGPNSSRYIFDDDEYEFEGNADFNFAFMEGDLGAIVGGAIGQTLPFDLPFAAGIMPLVFQNGIWMEDEILGFAVTIPARNSARFDISNMDITFFAGYDKLNSPAFEGDDSAARVMGIASFLDALNGHFEIDYAFLDDRTNQDRSYHNIGIGYTRRYGRWISNSTRVIVNAGQQSNDPGTADGVLLLSENSLITGHPSTVVPYLNMFAGFDRPQSVGRNGLAGGILRNTGILFESDNLTGYPTLDSSANDTFGMAMGLNLLADEFAQQLIVEMAMLGVMGDDVNRNALGDQYGVGVRYQLPLTNSVIFRADAMMGFLRDDEDINGGRMEIRKKF